MIPSVKVAAGIIWRDQYFLAAERPKGPPRGGFWEFPGGKQEPGESMKQTLCRELHEELGIHCLHIEPWQVTNHQYPDLHVELHFMHVLDFSGEPIPKEGQQLQWVTPVQALELPFLPADLHVLKQLIIPQASNQ